LENLIEEHAMHRLVPLVLALLLVPAVVAQELQPVALPAPQTSGGKPLMNALKERQSQRAFAPDPLPPQVLSNLLWAAWGINRPDSGKRTAPTARNRQEMDVYVVLAAGTYLYDAKNNVLQPVAAGDQRSLTGTQPFVKDAALCLVYVARLAADAGSDDLVWAGSHAGFIGENVYLFCASEGLATVVRGSVAREDLGKALKLPAGHRVLLAQTVGYPKR
jgi:nitroreductase